MDKSIYDINIRAIQTNHPHLMSVLNSNDRFEIKTTVNNEFKHITPPNPLVQSKRNVVVFGMGTGQWLLDSYKQIHSTLHRMYILEPNPTQFHSILQTTSLEMLLQDSRITWFINPDLQSAGKRMNQDFSAVGIWGLHFYVNPQCAQNHREVYESFCRQVQFIAENAKQNTDIQAQKGLIIQHNIIRNLPIILRSYTLDHFVHLFQASHGIVIGAGPSLDKNIDQLRNASQKALLIATDSALSALLKRDIIPHFVVSCDPLKLNSRHFEKIPSLNQMVLAYLPEVNYQILGKYPNHPYFLCLHDFQSKTLQSLSRWIPTKLKFERRMNAGYCAFALARQLGCSPIILTGMDLCLSSSGESHAEDTGNVASIESFEENQVVMKFHRQEGNYQSTVVQVEGYDGKPCLTFPYFSHMLHKLEQEIESMQTPVIDATEGGAKKNGTRQMTLNETLRSLPPKPQVTESFPPQLKPNLHQDVHSLLKRFNQLRQNVGLARQQIQSGINQLQILKNQSQMDESSSNPPRSQLDDFYQRFKELLFSPSLEEALDIGLGRLRIEFQRYEIPVELAGHEEFDHLHEHLMQWMKVFEKDLTHFLQLYTLVMENMKTALTSTRG